MLTLIKGSFSNLVRQVAYWDHPPPPFWGDRRAGEGEGERRKREEGGGEVLSWYKVIKLVFKGSFRAIWASVVFLRCSGLSAKPKPCTPAKQSIATSCPSPRAPSSAMVSICFLEVTPLAEHKGVVARFGQGADSIPTQVRLSEDIFPDPSLCCGRLYSHGRQGSALLKLARRSTSLRRARAT